MAVRPLVLLLVCVVTGVLGGVTDCDGLGCSHRCVQTAGKPSCTCPDGQALGEDKKTCEVPVSILLGMFRGIKMLTLGGKDNDLQPVISARATAFDYHLANKEIYAFSNNSIIKYSLSKSPEHPTVVFTTSTMATSIAVDWVHDQIFWICQQRSAVEAATLKGQRHRVILPFADTSEDSKDWHNLVIDPYVEKLFLVSSGGVASSDLVGQGFRDGIGGWQGVEDIALDTHSQLIYVIGNQGGNKYVASCKYDGSQPTQLFKVEHPNSTIYGFGVLGRVVYWQSNHEGENLYKAEVPTGSGKATITLVEEVNQIVYDMKIYHPNIQRALK